MNAEQMWSEYKKINNKSYKITFSKIIITFTPQIVN